MVYAVFSVLVFIGLVSLAGAVTAIYYFMKIAAMSGEEVQTAYQNGVRWPHQWIRYVGTPLYEEGRKKKIARTMARKRIARIGLDRHGNKSIYMESLKAMEERLLMEEHRHEEMRTRYDKTHALMKHIMQNVSGKPAETSPVDLPPMGPPAHYYGPWRLDKGI